MVAIKRENLGEQDGRRVGGCGVHISPQIHQKYQKYTLDTEVHAEHQLRVDRRT